MLFVFRENSPTNKPNDCCAICKKTNHYKSKRKTKFDLRYCIHISWSGKTFHNLCQLYFDSLLNIYLSLKAFVPTFVY